MLKKAPYSHEGVFLRAGIGLTLFFAGLEMAVTGEKLSMLTELYTASHGKISSVAAQLIGNPESFIFFAGVASLIAAVCLFAGVLVRIIGVLLSVAFFLALVMDPFFQMNPALGVLRNSHYIGLIGLSLVMSIKGGGFLSLSHLWEDKTKSLAKKYTEKWLPHSRTLLISSIAATLIIMFVSVFTWFEKGNYLWAEIFNSVAMVNPIFNLPVITSLIGSAGVLLFFGIAPQAVALATGLFLVVTISTIGAPASFLWGLVGGCLALIAEEEELRMEQYLNAHKPAATKAKATVKTEPKPKKTATKKPAAKKKTVTVKKTTTIKKTTKKVASKTTTKPKKETTKKTASKKAKTATKPKKKTTKKASK